jgi:C_GCAxxG_C_C family probable redox protein
MNAVIKKYSESDLIPIIELLKENNLPWDDLEPGKQVFFVAEANTTIVGCAAVEPYKNNGLFRSLSVTESYKNSGLGLKLLNQVIEYCVTNNFKKLYLLTTTADKYFEKHNWKLIERDVVPESIVKSKEFASICPSTAICMELSLTPYFSEQIFGDGFNCAQSVFVPFAMKAGIDKENAFKLATGFGAGMVYRGETCGAITGAMMAIGLSKGRSAANDYDSKNKTYMLINELYKKFKEKHGSIICKELLQLNGTGQESWAKASNEGKFDIQCPMYVKDAARIAEELILKY